MSKIINKMNAFLLFLAFTSRIPIPPLAENETNTDERAFGKSMKYYPVIGFLLGIITFSLFFALNALTNGIFNPSILALLYILIEIFLTGIIHLDGLADSFDGLFSYQNKEKILEIMKDSHIGTNAVIALILYSLIKYTLFAEILTNYQNSVSSLCILFLIMPIFSRLSVVYSCAFFPYAKKEGMAKIFVENTTHKDFYKSLLGVILFILLFSFFSSVSFLVLFLMLALIFMFTYLYNIFLMHKINGNTGDTFGALLELNALLTLLLFYLFV